MPRNGAPSSPARPSHAPRASELRDLDERELESLEAMLDGVPAPLEPLDVAMLDGFLCGVLLQPRPVPVAQWMPHVTDADARPLPAGFDARRLQALVLRRHAVLNAAITQRRWFDPWVFELHEADGQPIHHGDGGEDDEEAPAAIEAAYPWAAGFALALDAFAALMSLDPQALLEPLALVYRHLAPDDLEDADDLLAEIETLEPPRDLAEAVEDLVRATLLLADISRPLPQRRGASRPRR